MNFFKSSKSAEEPAAAVPVTVTAVPVAAAPKYPRVPYSKWAQILIWLNCASLIVCGILTFIFACIRPKKVTHFFNAIYMVVFGVLCVLAELRLPMAERMFGILCTKMGMAYCFIFVGTLGISFWVSLYAGILIPFISGIVSVVIGVLCIGEKFMSKDGPGSTRATETTVV